MSESRDLLLSYERAVRFPEVSGFEVLDLLDVRSRLADRERELGTGLQARLEEADSVFLRHAMQYFASVAEVGDLRDLRRRSSVPCSHWWWYLDKLIQREAVGA